MPLEIVAVWVCVVAGEWLTLNPIECGVVALRLPVEVSVSKGLSAKSPAQESTFRLWQRWLRDSLGRDSLGRGVKLTIWSNQLMLLP